MADGFRIDAGWLDALDNYVEGLATDTAEVAAGAVQFLSESVVDRARQRPEWVDLADNIETWSEDGRLTIGVRDRVLVSQAFAVEYGDETRPPSALFRTLKAEADLTKQQMQRELVARRGIAKIRGMW